jgi:hypothetical protein
LVRQRGTGLQSGLQACQWPVKARFENSFKRLFSPGLKHGGDKIHQLSHSRIFRTKQNYLGKGGVLLTSGDEVWILEQGLLPFILRPVSGESGSHTLIGECYVHRICGGRARQRGKGQVPSDGSSITQNGSFPTRKPLDMSSQRLKLI